MKQPRAGLKSLVATEACNHEEQAPPGEAGDVEGANSSEELHTPVGEDDAETLDDALCKGSEGAQCENLADALGKDHGAEQGRRKDDASNQCHEAIVRMSDTTPSRQTPRRMRGKTSPQSKDEGAQLGSSAAGNRSSGQKTVARKRKLGGKVIENEKEQGPSNPGREKAKGKAKGQGKGKGKGPGEGKG